MKVRDLRAMLAALDDNAEIVIQSCCGGGCVLEAHRVAPYREVYPNDGVNGLIVITDGRQALEPKP